MKHDYIRHDGNVYDVFLISHRLVSEFSLIGHKMVMLLKFLLRLERNWKMLKPRYSKLKQDVGLLQTWSHMVDMFLIVKILKNGKICQIIAFSSKKKFKPSNVINCDPKICLHICYTNNQYFPSERQI